MPFSASCPTCALPLVLGHVAAGYGMLQAITTCPKCGYAEHGPPHAGQAIEVEPTFQLRVALPPQLSVEMVKCLRACDATLRALPATNLLTHLRGSTEIEIGPFNYKAAMEQTRTSLERVGLIATPLLK